MFTQIDSVIFFVADIHAASAWYAEIFGVQVEYETRRFALIKSPSVTIGFQPLDAKSPGGVGGTTVFWQVEDASAAMDALIARGAQRQRGPYVSEDGGSTAIVVDPFGCALGLSSRAAK